MEKERKKIYIHRKHDYLLMNSNKVRVVLEY